MSTEQAFRTSHRYEASDGTRIVLECPWGPHSGNIPPPVITFYAGREYSFVYRGDDDA